VKSGLRLSEQLPSAVGNIMDFFETVHARQSVRAYHAKPVEPKQLEAILSAANQSPSAGNVQGYEILVVRYAATIRSLAKAAFNQMFIAQAPIVLVFCADPARSGAKYGVAGEQLYCVQDATIATAYAQLAATALGLATCWIGAFKEEDIAKVLGLRAGLRPIAMLPVGWPAETPARTSRRALNDLVREHKGVGAGG
jgi:nitroreductase